jgi:mannose-6-phosphate isomerase-like protein (cupin superfamily)
MPSYTLKNLKEIPDAAESFGLSPDLEARFAREAIAADNFALSYQRLGPNFRMPFGHKHEEQEELYVVVGGGGRLKLGDEVLEVRQWDAVRVPKDTMRAFEAGPEGLEYLAFGAPNRGANDAEMTQGWWTD